MGKCILHQDEKIEEFSGNQLDCRQGRKGLPKSLFFAIIRGVWEGRRHG